MVLRLVAVVLLCVVAYDVYVSFGVAVGSCTMLVLLVVALGWFCCVLVVGVARC